MSDAARSVRRAGVAYGVLGAAAVAFTLAAGLVPPVRLARWLLLVPGLAVIVTFGAALALAPRLWRRPWARTASSWLARVLAVTSTVRTLLFLSSAAGHNVHVLRAGRPDLFVVHAAPQPLFLVDAVFTGAIAVLLWRAGLSRP